MNSAKTYSNRTDLITAITAAIEAEKNVIAAEYDIDYIADECFELRSGQWTQKVSDSTFWKTVEHSIFIVFELKLSEAEPKAFILGHNDTVVDSFNWELENNTESSESYSTAAVESGWVIDLVSMTATRV